MATEKADRGYSRDLEETEPFLFHSYSHTTDSVPDCERGSSTLIAGLLKLWPWVAHAVLLTLSASMLVASVLLRLPQSDNCIKNPLKHFPEVDSINREYHTVRFDGSFDFSSPYKGPPSPKVDAAWENITELIGISITEEQFTDLNASIHSIKVPPKFGGGYLALPEFVHQIHCVHMLWQSTYPDYFKYQHDLSQKSPALYHAHMDHCADLLRQKLMCDVDMGLLTFNWVEHHSIPGPNFNVQHQCRNFDAAMEWAWKRRINIEAMKGEWWHRPEKGGWVDFKEPPSDPLDSGIQNK